MSMVIRVDLGRLPVVMKQLQQMKGYKKGLHAAGLHIQGELRRYPPVSRRKMIFVSAKQRRGFFARLKSGQIDVPYFRGISRASERLGARWAVDTSNGGLTVQVGNNARYANLVQGSEQIAYHKKTGWKTIFTVAKESGPRVQQIIARYVEDDIRA